jgi:hypothetical protein
MLHVKINQSKLCNRDNVLLKSSGRFQWNKVCVAMLPSSLALFQVNFAKLWSPVYYPFGYSVKRPLPICQLHFPKLQSPTSTRLLPKSPTPQCHLAILPKCQVHFTLWTAQMSVKLPNNFWAVSLIFLFQPAKTSAPKNQTDPDPRPLHALSFLLCLSFYFN